MLVMLPIILTAATVFPDLSGGTILAVLGGRCVLGAAGFAGSALWRRGRTSRVAANGSLLQARLKELRATWRMPPLELLPAPSLGRGKLVWMGVLRGYLAVAVILVAVKVIQVALGR